MCITPALLVRKKMFLWTCDTTRRHIFEKHWLSWWLDAWQHQEITRTNVDFSLVMYCRLHLIPILASLQATFRYYQFEMYTWLPYFLSGSMSTYWNNLEKSTARIVTHMLVLHKCIVVIEIDLVFDIYDSISNFGNSSVSWQKGNVISM